MHSQVKTAPPSAEYGDRDYHTGKLSRSTLHRVIESSISLNGRCRMEPFLPFATLLSMACSPSWYCNSQVAVLWIGFLGNVWSSTEFSIYASARQAQHQNLDWFKDDTDQGPGGQFFARNPNAESLGVTMLNRSDLALFSETPDSEWRTTSWHDFEEYTRLVCGNQGCSSHSRNSIPWQFQRRQFKCRCHAWKTGGPQSLGIRRALHTTLVSVNG